MPELPEVELIRRGLAATIVGRRVEAVDVLSPSTVTGTAAALERVLRGRELIAVRRRGKVMIVDLDDGPHLLVHPMMTGQFVLTDGGQTLFTGGHPSRSMLGPMPNHTTRVIFALSGGRTLFFNDGRKFARIRVLDDTALAADPFLCSLGPEPLEDGFTQAALRAQLERHRRAPVKAVILDQTVVAGVGNIYADESLHLARLHPLRPAGDLSATESARLHRAIRRVLTLAVEAGGTSFADNVSPGRAPVGYLARARVFRRQGLPCAVCGTTIERTHVAGRSTNFCPHCQPLLGSHRPDEPIRGPSTRIRQRVPRRAAAAGVS